MPDDNEFQSEGFATRKNAARDFKSFHFSKILRFKSIFQDFNQDFKSFHFGKKSDSIDQTIDFHLKYVIL